MEKLLKNFHLGFIAQFTSIQGVEYPTPEVQSNMQRVLEKHQQVFRTPKGLPPSRGEHDHIIPLIPGSQSLNV